MNGRKKTPFLGKFFKWELLMDLHGLRSQELKNHDFSCWSGYIRVCMRESVFSIIQKTSNKGKSKFYIFNLYHT